MGSPVGSICPHKKCLLRMGYPSINSVKEIVSIIELNVLDQIANLE